MPRLIIHGFTISLDGYGAGPHQSLEAPMGTGGQGLHPWLLRTHYFQKTHDGWVVIRTSAASHVAGRTR